MGSNNPPFFVCTFTPLPLLFAAAFALPMASARYPCMNDGEPVLTGENSEFRCECPVGFFGPFCQYQDTSEMHGKGHKLPTDKFPSQHQQKTTGWESTFVNLLLCTFFLLILPSLVVYLVRTLYLFLKRCHYYRGPRRAGGIETVRPPVLAPTPPPQYCDNNNNSSLLNHYQQRRAHWERQQQLQQQQQQQQQYRRRRSESPPITEVTVQLPASICRPLHGTRSLTLHQTTSLTLNEFHDLLLAMQGEMLMEQRRERDGSRTSQMPMAHLTSVPEHSVPPPLPPIEPPPNYESALLISPSAPFPAPNMHL